MEIGDGRALYEARIGNEHHDHMICLDTGTITEFYNDKGLKYLENFL